MHIGILEAGAPPGDLARTHGHYAAMVMRMLGSSHDYARYDIRGGALPTSPSAHAAYVVTGSAAGVNDGLAWVASLTGFLRSARGRARIVGICFGHQVIAHAFGGRVVKAPQGWGLGLTHYDLAESIPGIGDRVAAMASHQDQVVERPAGTTIIASNAFTPCAALAYPSGEALTMQFHPEFDAPYARGLIAAHTAPDIGDDLRAAAIASLDARSDNAAVGTWINRYLDGSLHGH